MFEGLVQPLHLVLILVVVLIIFGPGKLVDVGRALGQTVRELRESVEAGQPVAPPVPVDASERPTAEQPSSAPP